MDKVPFRWLGNKTSLLHHFGSLPNTIDRIIEPYAGSMAYSFNKAKRNTKVIGYEMDYRVVGIFDWLSKTSQKEIDSLRVIYEDLPQDGAYLNEIDVCQEIKHWLSLGGAMLPVFRNKIYPRMKHPNWESVKKCLPLIQSNNFNIVYGSSHELLESTTGDMLFVDPPYWESGHLYDADSYHPSQTIELINKANVPTILTYGDFAPEHFQEYNFNVLERITLNKPRKDSTSRTRTEHASYINCHSSLFNSSVFDILK